MSEFNRSKAIQELTRDLTEKQLELLRAVIVSADTQGDYCCSEDGDSIWCDDVQGTLDMLAAEFHKEFPATL